MNNQIIINVPVEVMITLRCKICQNILSVSPILIDTDGSNICGRCENPGRAIRNELYEKVIEKCSFPCSYQGCPEFIPKQNVTIHENNCLYKQMDCLISNCEWTGYKKSFLEHFMSQHNQLFIENRGKFVLFLNTDQFIILLNRWSDKLLVITLTYKLYNDSLTVSVNELFGNDSEKDKFQIKIQVENKNGTAKKLLCDLEQECVEPCIFSNVFADMKDSMVNIYFVFKIKSCSKEKPCKEFFCTKCKEVKFDFNCLSITSKNEDSAKFSNLKMSKSGKSSGALKRPIPKKEDTGKTSNNNCPKCGTNISNFGLLCNNCEKLNFLFVMEKTNK